MKQLTQAEYEDLCKVACRARKPADDTDLEFEKLLWWSVCHAIYHHLGETFMHIPDERAARIENLREDLQRLVHQAQSEVFDADAIAARYIREALVRS